MLIWTLPRARISELTLTPIGGRTAYINSTMFLLTTLTVLPALQPSLPSDDFCYDLEYKMLLPLLAPEPCGCQRFWRTSVGIIIGREQAIEMRKYPSHFYLHLLCLLCPRRRLRFRSPFATALSAQGRRLGPQRVQWITHLPPQCPSQAQTGTATGNGTTMAQTPSSTLLTLQTRAQDLRG